MEDLVETDESALTGIWQQEELDIKAEYVIPVGFLKKPKEGTKPHSFNELKVS